MLEFHKTLLRDHPGPQFLEIGIPGTFQLQKWKLRPADPPPRAGENPARGVPAWHGATGTGVPSSWEGEGGKKNNK